MSRALVAIVAISLFGCGGPYDDLARDFGVDAEQTGETLRVERVVLISTKHRGAYNYRGILDVSLTANAIEIRPRFPCAEDGRTTPANNRSHLTMSALARQRGPRR